MEDYANLTYAASFVRIVLEYILLWSICCEFVCEVLEWWDQKGELNEVA